MIERKREGRWDEIPRTDTQIFLPVLLTMGALAWGSLLPCSAYIRPSLLVSCYSLPHTCWNRWTLPTACEEVVNPLEFAGQERRCECFRCDMEYRWKVCILTSNASRRVMAVEKDWVQLVLVRSCSISHTDPGKNSSNNRQNQLICRRTNSVLPLHGEDTWAAIWTSQLATWCEHCNLGANSYRSLHGSDEGWKKSWRLWYTHCRWTERP